MSAEVIYLPASGWCVRAGTRCAHYLYVAGGHMRSACGGVERMDLYAPQRLRPLQSRKPHCLVCEEKLQKAAAL